MIPYEACKILGVPYNIPNADLKKKFRKLALEHHPDRGSSDPETFVKIKEAYDLLSKRRPQEIPRTRHKHRGDTIHHEIKISISDAFNGVHKILQLYRNIRCTNCDGLGYTDMTEPTPLRCGSCGGSGKDLNLSEKDRNLFSTKTCKHCAGRGWYYKSGCPICSGVGELRKLIDVEVAIPAGVTNKDRLTFPGKGHCGDPPGDLICSVYIEPNSNYKIDGLDIVRRLEVNSITAMVGGSTNFEYLDGNVIEIDIPPGTQNGHKIMMKRMGLRNTRKLNSYGDLTCIVFLTTPKDLSEEETDYLKLMMDKRE